MTAVRGLRLQYRAISTFGAPLPPREDLNLLGEWTPN